MEIKKKNLHYYLNSPLSIIVPYLILVFCVSTSGVSKIYSIDNSIKYVRKDGITIERIKTIDAPTYTPSNQNSKLIKKLLNKFIC